MPGPAKGSGGRPRKKAGTNQGRAGDGYKRVTIGPKSKGTQVYAHRAAVGLGQVKGSKGKGVVVDHKNRKTGDNSKGNLRRVSKGQNNKNR